MKYSSELTKFLLKIIYLVFFSAALIASSRAEPLSRGVITPAVKPNPSATQVKIGFYPVSVYELEMNSNTFYADFYVWLRWKGDIDPLSSLEFTNMVDEWGKQQAAIDENIQRLPDGSNYRILKVEGRFVQPFNFADYPLDRHKLSIRVEDSVNASDVVSFVFDQDNSGLGTSLKIPGWLLGGWSGEVFQHNYGTNFGEDDASPNYSGVQFNLLIERPVSYFFWKMWLPLLIVLIAALSTMVFSARSIDARTALPGGALLTAIFLQMGYSNSLPDLTYLVLMDKIYLVAYVLIVSSLVRAIVTFQRSNGADPSVVEQTLRTDKQLMVGQMFLFVVISITLAWMHGAKLY